MFLCAVGSFLFCSIGSRVLENLSAANDVTIGDISRF